RARLAYPQPARGAAPRGSIKAPDGVIACVRYSDGQTSLAAPSSETGPPQWHAGADLCRVRYDLVEWCRLQSLPLHERGRVLLSPENYPPATVGSEPVEASSRPLALVRGDAKNFVASSLAALDQCHFTVTKPNMGGCVLLPRKWSRTPQITR